MKNKTERMLVGFGEYLLSKVRKERTAPVNRDKVTHADLSNWELLEEERDGRMNVIAQNGNTGEHYENNAEECIGQECVDVNCSKHMV
jgi:hypothetical protein